MGARTPSRRKILLTALAFAVAAGVVAAAAGGLLARGLARDDAIRETTSRTDTLVADVAASAVQDGLLTGSATAVAALDRRVRSSVLGPDIARVKVWDASGTILYSDEPRLIGRRFDLSSDDLHALHSGAALAEVSNLSDPDNRYERGHGRLLEVVRGIDAPNGTPLLFEIYFHYDEVLAESAAIWRGFAAVSGLSVLLLFSALLPLLNGMIRSLERSRQQREALLVKALDASDSERRRIAAALHDGPVQDLVGASFLIGAATASYAGTEAGATLEAAESSVRGTIEGLRGTLVDIYPASLSEMGLKASLRALATSARSSGTQVVLKVEDEDELPDDAERLVFRIARETLANAVKHGAESVAISLARAGEHLTLTIRDDGPGFDAAETLEHPPDGHFGLRLLVDAVQESGVQSELEVCTAPGRGTTWLLRLL